MALDDVGYLPHDFAREIRRQLGSPTGYIDIDAVAYALDIVEIKRERLTTFEGALLTNAERSCVSILVNAASGRLRGRFTVAHELLHFLNDKHVQTEDGFRCRVSDIRLRNDAAKPGMSRHRRQEMEANRFAIELLAPSAAFDACIDITPDLDQVRKLSNRLDLSKEATARRYRELHEAQVALVFHRNGLVRYVDRPDGFPPPSVKKHLTMPESVEPDLASGTLTDLEVAGPRDWFDGAPMSELSIQTLYQKKGYGITMLTLDTEDPDDDGPEDTLNRYTSFS